MSESRTDSIHVARRQLTALLADEHEPDVVTAALWIAAEHDESLVVDRELRKIRQIADEGKRRTEGLDNPFARLDAVRVLLHEELGFRGNVEDYDDPRNSFLSQVLQRRLGIPLTLSVLFAEVARTAGFGACGVALPGHFIARVDWDGRSILVDSFHGGRVVSEEDCRDLVRRTTGRATLFRRELLDGTTPRATVGRLLLNLKHVFLSRHDYAEALRVVERLLLVRPGDRNEIRDRGLLQAHLGRRTAAIADLEQYLALAPGAPDTDSVAGRLRRLKQAGPTAD